MQFLRRNNEDELLEGNKYYWNIRKLLQDMSSRNLNEVDMTFKLQSTIWQNILFFHNNGFVYVRTVNLSRIDVYHLFDLRAGIVGDGLREIVSVKSATIVKLISRLEFDSFLLANEDFYLFVEIRRKDENVQKVIARKQQTQIDCRYLLLSGENSDVTLKVKQMKFDCHRCILAARSPIFAAMMKNDMEEKVSGVVIIEDADPIVFQNFLLFLYTGKEDYLSWQNVTDMYKLGDKYDVEDIKDICRNDIKENLRMSNFCELFKLSLLHNVLELTKIYVKFFLRHSKKIIRNENWSTFLSEGSNNWLRVDHVKATITTDNFFFFFKLSQIQNNSELTETTVQFFMKNSKENWSNFVRNENWMTFLVENPSECNILIRQFTDK